MNSTRIGVIGLGLMGTALAERLLSAGYEVVVYNRTREKADPLLERGARWSNNPIAECPRVLISLYTTETVRVLLSALSEGLHTDQILIDTTTGEPEQTVQLGTQLAAQGVHYLDAPISGSSEQTRRGEVTAIVGGERVAFDRCCDLFDCFAAQTIYAGPLGSGSRMKLVSNLVLGLNRAALAEGLVFGQSMGMAPEAVLQVLLGSMAYSRIMDTKGRKMIEGDFSTQARLSQHLKDIRLILDAAQTANQSLPLTDAHRQLLERAEEAGYGDADNSAIIRAYERLSSRRDT